MTEFAPRLDILPPPQRKLWDELAQVPASFVLYGGTALALYFGHRQSVDFDFFGDAAFDQDALMAKIPFLAAGKIIQEEPNTLSVIVRRGGAVKLSFFGLPAIRHLLPPVTALGNNLRVASRLDLAGMKAAVVQKRAEAKDYIDIDALLAHGIDLPTALTAAAAIYGPSFNPQITLKSLSYFGDGNLKTLPGDMKDRLAEAARAVDLDKLPALEQARYTVEGKKIS
ncbi:MAG TPA: nucleotidyl transferase AbiEii/AbiGii toxin family protein [Alphaproteobacteria bacterium]|nr:nucleotidyl transferase AbiEii/AbiGii toxin family protein [Alphaproteobacteria bacterium]